MTTLKVHLLKARHKHPTKVKAKLLKKLVPRLFQAGNPKLWFTSKQQFCCYSSLLHLCTLFQVSESSF